MKYEGLSVPTTVRPIVTEGNVTCSDINTKFMEVLTLALEMEKDRPPGTQKYDMIALKKVSAELEQVVSQWRARLRLLSRGQR